MEHENAIATLMAEIEQLRKKLNTPTVMQFGHGTIAIDPVILATGEKGVILFDTGESHPIGTITNSKVGPHTPQAGEIYLSFSNTESARVVLDILSNAVDLPVYSQLQAENDKLRSALDELLKRYGKDCSSYPNNCYCLIGQVKKLLDVPIVGNREPSAPISANRLNNEGDPIGADENGLQVNVVYGHMPEAPSKYVVPAAPVPTLACPECGEPLKGCECHE